MANRNWASETVTSRKVGAKIDTLLPADIETAETVSFQGSGPVRAASSPDGASGGTITVWGVIGARSQFRLDLELSLRRADSENEAEELEDWTVRTRFYRTEDAGVEDLDPFTYAAEWTETRDGETSSDSVTVDLNDVGGNYQFGGPDGVATLLLAEIIANRRGTANDSWKNQVAHHGSLSKMGSFETALENGRIAGDGWTFDWSTVAELLGPEASTVTSRVSIETDGGKESLPDRFQDLDFVSTDVQAPRASPDQPIGQQLTSLLDEIESMHSPTESPVEDLIEREVTETQERWESILRSFPEGFPAALDDGNFGLAREIAESADHPYKKMVMAYAFYELYAAIGQLQESDTAVQDIAAAITAFGSAINRGNTEMARLSLKRASDAFVTVTRELVEGAQSRLENLRGVLAFHDLSRQFDAQIKNRDDLGGTELSDYVGATEELVEQARKQHERAEKAREAFHLFDQQQDTE